MPISNECRVNGKAMRSQSLYINFVSLISGFNVFEVLVTKTAEVIL
jgi:hypothetical protein